MKKSFFLFGAILIFGFTVFGFFIGKLAKSKSLTTKTKITSQPSQPPAPAVNDIVPPVAKFKERATKKFFGTYVSPTNSPVKPERFQGFHTGVDVEYGDVTEDVPVYAISDGEVATSEKASGYGGVMVVKHQINGQTLYGIYGHLRPASLLMVGSEVSKGQQIAVLGTGYSAETDGERRHLHFGLTKTNTILGYVPSKEELNSTWIDPLTLY